MGGALYTLVCYTCRVIAAVSRASFVVCFAIIGLQACKPGTPIDPDRVAGWVRDDRRLIKSDLRAPDLGLFLFPISGAMDCKHHTGFVLPSDATIVSAPLPEQGVFVLDRGTLTRLVPDGERILYSAPGGLPALRELLGYESNVSPIQMLVTTDSEVWRLTLDDRSIVKGSPARDTSLFSSSIDFLQRVDTGRCRRGEQSCLVVNHDQGITAIDVAPRHGQPTMNIVEFQATKVTDVAWGRGDVEALYVLADLSCTGESDRGRSS